MDLVVGSLGPGLQTCVWWVVTSCVLFHSEYTHGNMSALETSASGAETTFLAARADHVMYSFIQHHGKNHAVWLC